jgi:hypothetical protein
MRRESIEDFVNQLLLACPVPWLILRQEDCSTLASSKTKEVMQSGNHDAFSKDLSNTIF